MAKGVNPRSVVQTVPMFRMVLLFVSGIIISDVLGDAVGLTEWFILFLVVGIGSAILYKVSEILCSLGILLGFVVVGGMRMSFDREDSSYIREDEIRVCDVVLISEPEIHGKVIMFDCTEIEKGERYRCSLLRDTITRQYEKVHIGDCLHANIDMTSLKDWHRINSNFDYVRWLKTRGFVGRGFIGIGKWEKREVGWKELRLWDYVTVKMLVFRERLLFDMRSMGMDEEAFAVGTAMAFGNKRALSPKLRDEYNVAGATHILALSGMHLSIIYMILAYMLGRKYKKWKKVLLLAGVWTYVLFVGMPLSVVRAAMMLTLWEVFSLLENSQDPLNVFGLTMLIMTAYNPQCLWDVGFQMSFSAVFAIIVFMGPISKVMPRSIRPKNNKAKRKMSRKNLLRYEVLKGIWYMGAISCSAQLGTAPLTAFYFGRVSLLFMVANFFVVPMAWLIVCGMLLLAMVTVMNMIVGGWLWTLARFVGWIVNGVVMVQNGVMKLIAAIPGASIEDIEMNGIQLIGTYVMIVGLAVFLNRKSL